MIAAHLLAIFTANSASAAVAIAGSLARST
jgi:hypothetical protein